MAPDRVSAVVGAADAANVAVSRLGVAGGDRLVVEGLVDLDLAAAVEAWRTALPRALGVEVGTGVP